MVKAHVAGASTATLLLRRQDVPLLERMLTKGQRWAGERGRVSGWVSELQPREAGLCAQCAGNERGCKIGGAGVQQRRVPGLRRAAPAWLKECALMLLVWSRGCCSDP